jgi:hypothetical protein
MKHFETLLCPHYHGRTLRVRTNDSVGDELLPENGFVVCDECEKRFAVRAGILDLLTRHTPLQLTMAGRSNLAPLSPQIYERVWRPRSTAWLTDGKLTLRQELALVREWVQCAPEQLVVDLGSATGLYARTIAQAHAESPTIIALDMVLGIGHVARRTHICARRRHSRFGVRACLSRAPAFC